MAMVNAKALKNWIRRFKQNWGRTPTAAEMREFLCHRS